jgi:hypothetical protein
VIEQIAGGQAAEGGGDRAQSHGSRRQIHHGRVLAPAGIGLQATELAERPEIVDTEPTAQVLDRVERGRGVGLHRHHIGGAQRAEVQRGQQADDRGRRGLVAADLEAVARAPGVGVVHHPRAQPEHAALDALEEVEVARGHG